MDVYFISPCLCLSEFGLLITKYHSLGGLNSKHLFCIVLEAGKSKMNVLADLVFGESPLPGLQMATFLLYSHMLERTVLVSLHPLIRALMLSWDLHPHDLI